MRPDPGSTDYMQRRAKTFKRQHHTERRKHIRRQRRIAQKDGPILFAALVALHGRQCAACGRKHRLTLDHILPVSKGGRTVIENLQILCGKCNKLKSDAIMDCREE